MTGTAAVHRVFRVHGTTDEVTSCGMCPKVDLKSTVMMMELDAEGNDFELHYFGSDCAARAAGWTQARVKSEARAADAAAKKAAYDARIKAIEEDGYVEAAAFASWATAAYDVHPAPRFGVRVTHSDVYDALEAKFRGHKPRRSPVSFLKEFLAETIS